MQIKNYLAEQRRYFERNMEKYLPHPGSYPPSLRQAMEYSLFAGGKRLRPILALATAEGCGESKEVAMAPAAALEMIHTYSLIHDDLPAMDDDDLRRGKPTSHRVFGEGMAILAGDALLTHAFSVVTEEVPYTPETALNIVAEIAKAAGPRGMIAGQALDISALEVKDPAMLNYIHACKTGALIKASVRTGAMAAGADEKTLEGLTKYAAALGLAYQIIDDILDVEGDAAIIGKDTGSDARTGKQTFVSMFGLDEAKKMAAQETENAVEALGELEGSFDILMEIARYIGQRNS